ncbi:MAG TPA: FHA domain-containing protein [Microcella sp.]|nr:FHA domain-containing protein [Microcella sp.]
MSDSRGDDAAGDAPDFVDRSDVEDTVIRLVEPPSDTAPRAVASAVDDVLRRLPASVRRAPRASSAVASDDDPTVAHVPDRIEWMLAVRNSATSVPLDRPVLVGRSPATARITGPAEPRKLIVPRDRRGVSSTHARIEQVGDSLVVTDVGSTNGLVVHWASGPPRRLRPGESCVVLPDAAVDLGDGIVIEFHPNPSPPEEHP